MTGPKPRPAQLSPMGNGDWPVWLSRRGAEMCAAALEQVRRGTARNGGAAPNTDFEWLAQVLRLAVAPPTNGADGSGLGTETVSVRINVPSSAPVGTRHLTTRAVAELAGVSDRTVRKAIASGRLAADRAGWTWLVDERDARHWAGARKGSAREGSTAQAG